MLHRECEFKSTVETLGAYSCRQFEEAHAALDFFNLIKEHLIKSMAEDEDEEEEKVEKAALIFTG